MESCLFIEGARTSLLDSEIVLDRLILKELIKPVKHGILINFVLWNVIKHGKMPNKKLESLTSSMHF